MSLILDGTNGVSDIDGSAATPAVRGVDANTGMFFGTDIVGLSTGGAERLRIDSSGNVGIGVTPSAWLSTYKSIQFSNSSAVFGTTGETLVGTNIFVNSSDENKYITTDEASMYRQANGNHIFYSAASGTAGNTISFSNVLSVNRNTTLVLQGGTSTSGTGIAFPATQSASSDANTLDDYEEGTFTPTANDVAFIAATGWYVKIGKQVFVSYKAEWPSTTNSSPAYINNLPFAIVGGQYSGAISITNFGSSNILAMVNSGTTIIILRDYSNNTYLNSNLSSKFVYGWAVYTVS